MFIFPFDDLVRRSSYLIGMVLRTRKLGILKLLMTSTLFCYLIGSCNWHRR